MESISKCKYSPCANKKIKVTFRSKTKSSNASIYLYQRFFGSIINISSKQKNTDIATKYPSLTLKYKFKKSLLVWS